MKPLRNPTVAANWESHWRTHCADRWSATEGAGLSPIRVEKPAPVRANCRETILSLERQINGGAQLSEVEPR